MPVPSNAPYEARVHVAEDGYRELQVVCSKRNAISTVFTNNKIYLARQAADSAGDAWSVMDDTGQSRIIIPDQKSAHLVIPHSRGSVVETVGSFLSLSGVLSVITKSTQHLCDAMAIAAGATTLDHNERNFRLTSLAKQVNDRVDIDLLARFCNMSSTKMREYAAPKPMAIAHKSKGWAEPVSTHNTSLWFNPPSPLEFSVSLWSNVRALASPHHQQKPKARPGV